MPVFHIHDQIRFRTITPEGPLSGAGEIVKIFPAGQSHWLVRTG